ncbi:putative hydrolase, CocE/NonD family [Mesorhizobium australicum WSM2073]|uniref:Hydrolase CocE/NonD family protein n=4 Tax=Phyllobacteriaceae TaxID=69277 RepID=E8THM7_MESCW|nr:hydrolase CocE/NonD family protein [Mesorhizobium ciceri biovar biserrulae WSM1271]AEH90675.1 hydrolase CocE/NonD family protein [Mesorhizobium opportunistum WSM2075]AGB48047.1 putative hydrolase, CocE/NonD family [Mesorhizobium australicum WSM2073]OBP90833.1 hydrolase [Mesorhizobium loti]
MVQNAPYRLRQRLTATAAAIARSASAVLATPTGTAAQTPTSEAAQTPTSEAAQTGTGWSKTPTNEAAEIGTGWLNRSGQTDQPVPLPKPRYEVDVEKDVRIPMHDGVGHYADIYRPRGVAGPLPTIMIRTQYNKAGYLQPSPFSHRSVAVRMFAGQGFAVVVQDLRGRFRSEGTFHLAESDAMDGYDTVAWIASQSWSNGRVGGYGCSALGITQVMTSQRRPPALKAVVPQGAAGALRSMPWDELVSGVHDMGCTLQWFRESANQRQEVLKKVDYWELLKTLPVADLGDRAGGPPNDWRDWHSRELGGPWWGKFGLFDEFSHPDVPALFVDSWYDGTVGGTLELFDRFQKQSLSEEARRNQYVIISPTGHCESEQAPPYIVGQRDVGDNRLDWWSIYLRWFNHWLRDGQGGFDMPHVQYFLIGANQWKSSDSWPLPGTRFVPYYLSSGGHANTSKGDGRLSTAAASGPPDRYHYDPADPVISPEPFRVPPGPGCPAELESASVSVDQRQTDLRDDRLVFTTEPLRSGIEVTGPLRAVLYVSSSAVDTDFVVQLSDVYPDGRVYNLRTGIARARYREGYKPSKLMIPGQIYPIEVNLHATGNYFAPGHRIRVQVSSSSFPHFGRNLNTGGNNLTETRWVVAENTIYHDRDHPSQIILPIVP